MESRTRVEAALDLDVADRPPIGAWGHSYLKEWSPKDLASATIGAQRAYGWDFVKFQPRATCFAETFGAKFHPSGDPLKAPVSEGSLIRAPADWEKVARIDPNPSPLADQVESVGLVAGELGAGIPVMQTVFSPISVAAYLSGRTKRRLIEALRDSRNEFTDALERIASVLVDFSIRSVEAGAAGIFYAISGYASSYFISSEEYRSRLLEFDRRVLEALPTAAWFNVVHICGSRIHFDLTKELPVRAVSWSVHGRDNPSLQDGLTRSAKAAMGGIDQRGTLLRGPKEAIAQEADAAIKANGGRGVLLAPGCSVPPEVPAAHLTALSEAARPSPRSRKLRGADADQLSGREE